MQFLSKNKSFEDLAVLGKICFDVISQDVPIKKDSDEFCGVYFEGRNRELNCIEDFAVVKSFKIHSEYNYPFLVVCHNFNNFLNNHPEIKNWRIKHIQIPEINSHEGYSKFFIKDIFNYIPEEYKKAIFHHPDGFLIKAGWEKFVKDADHDFLGAKWLHSPSVELFTGGKWINTLNFRTRGCNGGFSYRYIPRFRAISRKYGDLKLREVGTEDKFPAEDLFYGYHIFGEAYPNIPSLEIFDKFCLDPIELDEYNNKVSFGFHYPKRVNEWKNVVKNSIASRQP